jgi:hypothetical protein
MACSVLRWPASSRLQGCGGQDGPPRELGEVE